MSGQNLSSVVGRRSSEKSIDSPWPVLVGSKLSSHSKKSRFLAPNDGARNDKLSIHKFECLLMVEEEQQMVSPVASDSPLEALSSQSEAGLPSHTHLLEGLHLQVELVRARTERRPAQSVTDFSTKTVWGNIDARLEAHNPNYLEPGA